MKNEPHDAERGGEDSKWWNHEPRWWELLFVAAIGMAAVVGAGDGWDTPLGAAAGGVIGAVMWFVEGFIRAITNPWYLGGLFVGFGTGWILGRGWPRSDE